jgi:hypothetical protein
MKTTFLVLSAITLFFISLTNAKYVVISNHFALDHFWPNRCGVDGYNCCNDKTACKTSNNTQGVCVQHRTTDRHCYARSCNPKCAEGYVCTNTNLCVKINQTVTSYEQVDFTCPAGHYGNLYRWGNGIHKWKNNKVFQCAGCPHGQYSPGINNDTKCRFCEAGYRERSRKRCGVCPNGRYSFHGAWDCWHSCPNGAYHDGGEKTCTLCPKGRYNKDWGKKDESACLACAEGKYSDDRRVCYYFTSL